jgi:hypothetical protein
MNQMTSSERLQGKTALIDITLILLTSLSIYLIYGSYLFSKWPWISFSILMAILTCLWPYVIWFFHVAEGINEIKKGIFSSDYLSIIFVSFNFCLLYPGPKKLGMFDDPYIFILIIAILVIHGIGSYLIERLIKHYLAQTLR